MIEHTFRSPSKTWRGVAMVQIAVTEWADGWVHALSFAQLSGDHLGVGEPAGFGGRRYPTETAALHAGIERLRAWMTGRPKELARHLAFLDSITATPAPTQPDLFGDPA